ncbi:MAG: hypothetical protein QXZ19_00125 [Thermoplasmata archaeon]
MRLRSVNRLAVVGAALAVASLPSWVIELMSYPAMAVSDTDLDRALDTVMGAVSAIAIASAALMSATPLASSGLIPGLVCWPLHSWHSCLHGKEGWWALLLLYLAALTGTAASISSAFVRSGDSSAEGGRHLIRTNIWTFPRPIEEQVPQRAVKAVGASADPMSLIRVSILVFVVGAIMSCAMFVFAWTLTREASDIHITIVVNRAEFDGFRISVTVDDETVLSEEEQLGLLSGLSYQQAVVAVEAGMHRVEIDLVSHSKALTAGTVDWGGDVGVLPFASEHLDVAFGTATVQTA